MLVNNSKINFTKVVEQILSHISNKNHALLPNNEIDKNMLSANYGKQPEQIIESTL